MRFFWCFLRLWATANYCRAGIKSLRGTGIVSWYAYFLKSLKIKSVFFVLMLMVFTIIAFLFRDKTIKNVYWLLLWNHILTLKIFPVTLFRRLVPANRNLSVIIKVVRSESSLRSCKLLRKPAMTCCTVQWEKSTTERSGKSEQLFWWRFQNSLKNCKSFQRSKQKLYVSF